MTEYLALNFKHSDIKGHVLKMTFYYIMSWFTKGSMERKKNKMLFFKALDSVALIDRSNT